jgi:outer membrane protein OmpA-like peptidoglycan-associated protein
VLLATTVVSAIALPQIVRAFEETSSAGRIVVAQNDDAKRKQQQQQEQQRKAQQQQQQQQQKAQQLQQQQQQKAQQLQQQQQQKAQQFQQQQQQKAQQFQQQQQKAQQQQQQKAQQQQQQKAQQQQQQQQQKAQQFQQQQQQKAEKFQQQQQQKAEKLQQQQQQKAEKLQQQQQQKAEKLQQQQQQKAQQFQQQQQQKAEKLQQLQQQKAQQQQQKLQQQKFGPQDAKSLQPPPKLEPQTFGKPKVTPGTQVGNVSDIKGKREEIRKGNTVIIREPGNRVIIRDNNNRIVIRNDDSVRMRRWGNARYEVRGQERYTIVRRGNFDVYSVTDADGRLLRRYRRGPDGREYVLIDNRRRWGPAVGVGAAVVGGAVLLGLAMPVIAMPRERYIVDVDTAPPMMLYEALEAPPVVPLQRAYTLDEIRDNVEVRAHVRSVNINTINFATGSWEVSPDQIPRLQALAEAMLRVINENSSTVFMIEGHTDAVGSPEDNLSLSDRRAEAVAEILTSNFNIPPENLVTQGYGEQHLRVQTDGPNRENRRVEVRNITGLMAGGDGSQPGGIPGQPPG